MDEFKNLNQFVELSDEDLRKISGGDSGPYWDDPAMIMNGWGSWDNYNAGNVAASHPYNPYWDPR